MLDGMPVQCSVPCSHTHSYLGQFGVANPLTSFQEVGQNQRKPTNNVHRENMHRIAIQTLRRTENPGAKAAMPPGVPPCRLISSLHCK